MARNLVVSIGDELDKAMSKYPEVDWSDAVRKSLRECIRRKEIAEMYISQVERTFSKKSKKS